MNVHFRTIALPLAFTALAGCASMDERASLQPQGGQRIVENGEYIAVVEELAKRRGVRVKWVNPPYKRLDQAQD